MESAGVSASRAGLSAPASVPVMGTISSPANTVSLHALHPEQEYADRSAPRGGIAPDLMANSGVEAPAGSLEDRGIFHTANAMKDLYDMGDSPSCATCGAIMTRSGSCYRCNECGSTSGCS